MDEGPDGTGVVLQLFGKRQGAADQARNPLSKGAVEALNIVCFAAALASSPMAFSRKDFGVRLPEVGVEHSALPIDTGKRAPETFSARLASTTNEHTDDLSGCGVQCQPDPLFVPFRAYKRPDLIALDA